jgi:hypothetical protein
LTQHAALTEERWARFQLDQQIQMIAMRPEAARQIPFLL